MADESWIGDIKGKRRRAFIDMITKGEGVGKGTSPEELDQYAAEMKQERQDRRAAKKSGIYRKSFEGRAADIDLLGMAVKMAERTNDVCDKGGRDTRKKTRALADGSQLIFKGGDGVDKVRAVGPQRKKIKQENWEKFISEFNEAMDNPDGQYQIQPCFFVWDADYDDTNALPCGILITKKFGPPYLYLPRILKTKSTNASGEEETSEATLFEIIEFDSNAGGSFAIQLAAGAQRERTVYMSYINKGIEDTTYITTKLAHIARGVAGEYKWEYDDVEENYHGAPESSAGLQEIKGYQVPGIWAYSWYSCPLDRVVGVNCEEETNGDYSYYWQRRAPNHWGDDWIEKEDRVFTGFYRKDEWHYGTSQKTRSYFDGDCGRLDIIEREAIWDAKYLGYNTIMWLWAFADYLEVEVAQDPDRPWDYTNWEYGLNHKGTIPGSWPPVRDLDFFPYPLYACPFSYEPNLYEARSWDGMPGIEIGNTDDMHDAGDSQNTPMYYDFTLPTEQNVRTNCHNYCSCTLYLGREWYHEGSYTWSTMGQVLADAAGKPTTKWIAWTSETKMGEYYFDHTVLQNGFAYLTVLTSAGYRHEFGRAGALSMRSSYEMNCAAIYDTRSAKQTQRLSLMTCSIYEIKIQDGTNDMVTNYPQFLGPIKTWGEKVWGGGRTGLGCQGETLNLTGTDRVTLGFIIGGRKKIPEASTEVNIVVEAGGSGEVCWRREITPNVIYRDTTHDIRNLWYNFSEEKACAQKWPPAVPMQGVKADDEDNGFPENGYWRYGCVPIKIYYRPRNWTRTAKHPGKTEETHGQKTVVEDEW